MNEFSSIRISRRARSDGSGGSFFMLLTSLRFKWQRHSRDLKSLAARSGSRCQGDGIYLYEHSKLWGPLVKWMGERQLIQRRQL